MDKILLALYEEIAHGNQEHRDWLYQKMQEFFEKEVGKQFKFNMVGEAGQSTLTFGQKAVGLTFNPGGNPEVELVKRKYAELVDLLDSMRTTAEGSEKKRMYSVAITEAQTSQMWAVKAITWQY